MNAINAKTTVVKLGGATVREQASLELLGAYVAGLVGQPAGDAGAQRVVVVHGGGPEIGALHQSLQVPFVKDRGLRVTSEQSMPLVTMVLCGLVNKRIVAQLVARGLPALGLSGVDCGLLRAELLNARRLGRVGGPPRVDLPALERLLDLGLVPVLAPVCIGPDGEPVNVNADTVAHAVATSLRAETLDFVSDVPGVRVDEHTVAPRLTVAQVQRLLGSSVITGGMVPKLQAALAAVDAGVGRVRVGDLAGMQAGSATEVIA